MSDAAPYLGEFEQLLLLAILQCGDEAYTVPIRELLADRTNRRVARGAVHTALDRLEQKGLVRSEMGAPLAIRGGRARRYYQVTPLGLAALRSVRSTLIRLSAGLESLLDRQP